MLSPDLIYCVRFGEYLRGMGLGHGEQGVKSNLREVGFPLHRGFHSKKWRHVENDDRPKIYIHSNNWSPIHISLTGVELPVCRRFQFSVESYPYMPAIFSLNYRVRHKGL